MKSAFEAPLCNVFLRLLCRRRWRRLLIRRITSIRINERLPIINAIRPCCRTHDGRLCRRVEFPPPQPRTASTHQAREPACLEPAGKDAHISGVITTEDARHRFCAGPRSNDQSVGVQVIRKRSCCVDWNPTEILRDRARQRMCRCSSSSDDGDGCSCCLAFVQRYNKRLESPPPDKSIFKYCSEPDQRLSQAGRSAGRHPRYLLSHLGFDQVNAITDSLHLCCGRPYNPAGYFE